MKILLIVSFLIAAAPSHAAYLRLIDLQAPVKVAGVWIDPIRLGQTSVGSAVALVTHDPKDGCLLPSIVCEQWAPLTTGITYNGGRFYWNVGPAANVLPWMQAGLRAAANGTGLSDRYPGLGAALAPAPGIFSFGPQLNLNPISAGQLQPFNRWNARLVLFTGAEIRWK